MSVVCLTRGMRPEFTAPPKLSPGDRVAVVSRSFAAPGLFPAVHELSMRRLREELKLETLHALLAAGRWIRPLEDYDGHGLQPRRHGGFRRRGRPHRSTVDTAVRRSGHRRWPAPTDRCSLLNKFRRLLPPRPGEVGGPAVERCRAVHEYGLRAVGEAGGDHDRQRRRTVRRWRGRQRRPPGGPPGRVQRVGEQLGQQRAALSPTREPYPVPVRLRTAP